MCSLYRKFCTTKLSTMKRKYSLNFSKISSIVTSEEVRNALEEGKPVIALESTIITHGMPYPDNVNCALEVEAIVRKQGVTPATIAIIDGAVKVGLSEPELNQLGDVKKSQPVKTSRRDLPYVLSKNLSGGTTVSGTLVIAQKCGIPIFATGGIGGVHREGEKTFDVSADLVELGKTNVAVVSSGVKSILDIPKTLEYLETQGVFVATFGSDSRAFPAFYTRKSACKAPYLVKTAQEAAGIIHCSRRFDIRSGMLFAVPVPEEFALNEEVISGVIEEALKDARKKKIEGKDVTPFLLAKIGEITGGKSLETNISLIKNNAKVAASIALELAKLKEEKVVKSGVKTVPKSKPVVIGGSNLDCSFKLEEAELKLDGRIHFAKSVVSGGGVGRNICEALFKLGCAPLFISVLGNDAHGSVLSNFIPKDCMELVKTVDGHCTGCCTAVFDATGECKFLVGDMRIHREITPEMIYKNAEIIKKAPLAILDGNLTVETIEAVLELAEKHNVPVFFEPTDVVISIKPFQTKYPKTVKFMSPNLNELKYIASYLKITSSQQDSINSNKIIETVDIVKELAPYIDTIIVTLGPDGVIIGRKGEATESLLSSSGTEFRIRHYPVKKIENKQIINVSGAGDCLISGIITAMLAGLSEEKCLSVGLAAANSALFSSAPVADSLFGTNHEAWRSSAIYKTLY